MAPRILARITQDLAALAHDGIMATPYTRLAFCGSLGAVAALLAAFALHLDDPWWAGISALSIIQNSARSTLTRALERVGGTIAGAVLGVVLAPLVAWHLPFEIACAGVTAFTIYAQERTLRSYAVLLGGVTTLLVMFGTLQAPNFALHLAVYRSLEVTTGILFGSLASYAFGPAAATALDTSGRPGILGSPVDVELCGIALMGGIAVASVAVVWTTFDLPSLGQTPITAFVVLTAFRGDPNLKASARLLGCGSGAFYGIAALGIAGDQFALWIGLLALGLYLACYVQQGGSDASYAGQQAAVALIMAMVEGPAASPDLLPVLDRLIGIVGGIVIVWFVTALLGPLRLRIFKPST